MDYRRFLAREEERVLPYLGGASVHAPERRLRVPRPFEPAGWYRFTVEGRVATVKERAEPLELERMPMVRGHLIGARLVREGAIAEPVELMPEEVPPRFAPCRAHRWPSGDLLFGGLELEGGAEEAARRALEEDGTLTGVKGAPASLRAAFGYAIIEEVSRRLAVPVTPAEVRAHVRAVAERGRPEAEALLRRLTAERALAGREMHERLRRRELARLAGTARAERERRLELARRTGRGAAEDAELRAEAACEAAGARLRGTRPLGGGHMEVIFTFMGERFISVVELATLRLVDSGICLGHPPRDDLLTLDSLFPVIREAIETDRLVILRHA